MRKFLGPMGSVTCLAIESEVLKNNMLGDPSTRVADVYVPAGHDGQGLPLLVDLVGFTGSGLSHTNWVGFRENLPGDRGGIGCHTSVQPVSPLTSPTAARLSTRRRWPCTKARLPPTFLGGMAACNWAPALREHRLCFPDGLSRYYRLWFLGGVDSDRLLHWQQLAVLGYACAGGRQLIPSTTFSGAL